ncbi:MAG: hypothetical protein AB1656_07220 [Candidatus Omnitrophota bacterium]
MDDWETGRLEAARDFSDTNGWLKRIEVLEKRHRRLRRWVLFLGCLCALFLARTTVPRATNTVNRLLVRSASSGAAIDLFIADGGPCIKLSDRKGRGRMDLFVNQGNPELYLSDSLGKLKLRLSAADEKPGVYFYGIEGQLSVGMTVQNNAGTEYDDKPVFNFFDNQGNLKASMSIQTASPEFSITDAKGEVLFRRSF